MEVEPVHAWSAAERDLPPRVAAALAATGIVKVVPLDPPGRWLIETDSYVGILVGEGWELRILPRIQISKLLFLLTYSLRPRGWEGVATAMAGERDLVQALAAGFCLHAERVAEQGLLRGYVPVQERRNDLRGRVRFKDQLTRLAGRPLPLEVAYDDFATDVLENRLLRTALEVLLALDRVAPPSRARLLRLRALLEEVGVLHDRSQIKLPPITRLNQRYDAALVIAKLILDGTSLRQERGALPARSFLFDMNEVFESFLFAALRESLRAHGGVVQRQVRGSLDTAAEERLRLRCDIVWRKRGEIRALIDAKYKSLSASAATPSEDAYQMLAYCVGFGVRRGTLLYVREGPDTSRLHEVKRHGYEIDVRAVGLDQEPPQLLAEVDRIAADIAAAAQVDANGSLPAEGDAHPRRGERRAACASDTTRGPARGTRVGLSQCRSARQRGPREPSSRAAGLRAARER